MIDFLFNSERFVPRAHCGTWDRGMEWLYMHSHLFIFFAYLAIPVLMVVTGARVEDLQHSQATRMLFAAFIVCCGVGHLEGVFSFRWPAYHAFAVWHAVTAAVSWATVLSMFAYRGRYGSRS